MWQRSKVSAAAAVERKSLPLTAFFQRFDGKNQKVALPSMTEVNKNIFSNRHDEMQKNYVVIVDVKN